MLFKKKVKWERSTQSSECPLQLVEKSALSIVNVQTMQTHLRSSTSEASQLLLKVSAVFHYFHSVSPFFLQPRFYFPKAPIHLCLPFCTNLRFSPWSSLNFLSWDYSRKYLCSKLWRNIIAASLPATLSPINSRGQKELLPPTLQCNPFLLPSSESSEYTSPMLLKVIRILTIKTNNYRKPMMIQSDYFANYPMLSISNIFFDLNVSPPQLSRTGKEKGGKKTGKQ